MILTVTLNPSVDHTLFIDGLRLRDANRVRRVERDAGGKGLNLSRVYSELGGGTLATGLQPHGASAMIRQVLDEQGVGHDFVEVPGETRVNISVEDGSGEPPTSFNERGAPTPEGAWDDLVGKIRHYAPKCRWIAVGGSIPPGLDPGVYAELTDLAHELKVPILVDADGEALKLAAACRPDMIKPNEDEAARFLNWTPDRVHAEPIEALKGLENAAETVVLTLGSAGAWLRHGDEVIHAVPPKIEVRSTIGSGDSLLAGLLFGHGRGQSWADSLALGVACGAATALTDGCEIARRPMIDELLPQVYIERVTIFL